MSIKRNGGLLLAAAAWQAWSVVAPSPFHPSLWAIGAAAWRFGGSGELWPHLLASGSRFAAGSLIAAAGSLAFAVLLLRFPGLTGAGVRLADALRPVSAIALFPVFLLWFGVGSGGQIAVIVWAAWPPLFVNTLHGLQATPPDIIAAAQLDGATPGALLRWLRLPLAAPFIVAGLRIGLGTGWVALIAAEMLGGSRGLGWSIWLAANTFEYPRMYALIGLTGVAGLLIQVGGNALQRWVQEDG